jgi:hypothetical protein
MRLICPIWIVLPPGGTPIAVTLLLVVAMFESPDSASEVGVDVGISQGVLPKH